MEAIMIRDAVKTYDKNNVVLRRLNMTVPKGKIYGLLGPSGCGKTTLLNIIVGRSELDSGNITIDAFKREDIGYMPQGLDLHTHLTILQTFKFYGRMLNMDVERIVERAKELITLLDLPHYNRMIYTLSGGQQRRVSLGVALLHNPNILILDEPTVGLDPVLSNNIWNHLVSFSEEGKTVIITTHYIEEARQAHMIGMMREGILVAEESPEKLMVRCRVTTLEEAFLTLSRKQETTSDTQDNLAKDTYKSCTENPKTKLNLNDDIFRINRMYCLLYKNICLLLQQKSFTAFLLILPFAQTYFFNQAVGHDPQWLNIAVINKEIQQRRLGECRHEYYNECFLDKPQDVMLSCAFIDHIKSKSLNVIYYDKVDIALNDVKKNKAWSLLYFPDNYTTSMAVRFTMASKTPSIDVELSIVQVWIDFSDLIIGNMLKSKINIGVQEYLGNALTLCNISSKLGFTPISFKEPIFGSVNTSFIHYASASIICLCCYFLPALFTMGMILMEKNEGMMERMAISGIKLPEVLVSTFIIQTLVQAVQTAISMYVMYIYFDNPYLGDHLPTIMILMLIGTEGMILGFLIGTIFNSIMVAAYLGAGLNIAFCFTCGMIWPLESAHYLIKFTGPLLPITAPIKTLLAITAKGWSFDSATVYLGFISIFCWSSIMIIITFIASRLNKDFWVSRK